MFEKEIDTLKMQPPFCCMLYFVINYIYSYAFLKNGEWQAMYCIY